MTLAGGVLVVIELCSFGAGAVLRGKGVFYEPSIGTDYGGYLARRDPVVGWPAPDDVGADSGRDPSGARNSTRFPYAPGARSCISLYGDSFTWGAEVADDEAWADVLAGLAGCRVANFGVAGYGTDQAYLRFAHNADDTAKTVILGHLTENVLRNVNQLRDLLYPGHPYGFKPRFVVGAEGALEFVPLPDFPAEAYPAVMRAPEAYLRHEWFLPGGPAGIVRLRFPYFVSVLRAFGNFHVRAELRGEPWYAEFYAPDHPSNALEVTLAILERFRERATEAGQRPLVLILPTGLDLSRFRERGDWVYGPLLDGLTADGIEFLDAGPAIMERIGDRDPCTLFVSCSRHFNTEGNRLLAEIVEARLSVDAAASTRGVVEDR